MNERGGDGSGGPPSTLREKNMRNMSECANVSPEISGTAPHLSSFAGSRPEPPFPIESPKVSWSSVSWPPAGPVPLQNRAGSRHALPQKAVFMMPGVTVDFAAFSVYCS
jgi:hypothetical protein